MGTLVEKIYEEIDEITSRNIDYELKMEAATKISQLTLEHMKKFAEFTIFLNYRHGKWHDSGARTDYTTDQLIDLYFKQNKK